MSAVCGTRRAIKELADGTIRVQIDIDPPYRRLFLETFPDIDMPIALAPLNLTTATEPLVEKGGELARLAGQLCNDEAFRKWLAWYYPGATIDYGKDMEDGPKKAAAVVRGICGITTRARLDHDADAAETFHREIRKPWAAYQGANE